MKIKSFRRRAMASVDDIALEIRTATELIASRNGDAASRLVHSTAAALDMKLRRLTTFSSVDALNLQQELAKPNVPHELKDKLELSIDCRLTQTHTAPQSGKKKGANKDQADKEAPQLLEDNLLYMTNTDWAKLREQGLPEHILFQVFYYRFNRLGIRSLDEQTVKWVIATILHVRYKATRSWPAPQRIKQMVDEFKRCYPGFKTPYMVPGAPYLVDYPQSPHELPAVMYRHAYEADDPPVTVEIDEYRVVGDQIPLRKSSRLLRDVTGHSAPAPAAPAPTAVVTWDDIRTLMEKSQNGPPQSQGHFAHWRSQSPESPRSDSFRITGGADTPTQAFQHPKPSEDQQLAAFEAPMPFELEDKHLAAFSTHSNDRPGVQHPHFAEDFRPKPKYAAGKQSIGRTGVDYEGAGSEEVDLATVNEKSSAEDIEAAALEKLMQRKKKRKRGGAAKRPAGCTVQRRPAACDGPWKDVCYKLTEKDMRKDIPRLNFVSNVYKAARTKANNAGLSTEDQGKVARCMHARAGQLWDKKYGH